MLFVCGFLVGFVVVDFVWFCLFVFCEGNNPKQSIEVEKFHEVIRYINLPSKN